MWIKISQLLKKQADQDPTVCHAAFGMLDGLVDMIVTCFHMLKIARLSDDNYLIPAFSKFASAILSLQLLKNFSR